MSLEIVAVDGARDRRRFVDLPFHLFRSDPTWIPPLRLAVLDRIGPKHPANEHQDTAFWMAMRDGRVVGRIGACIDRLFDEFQDERWSWVGFFECADDQGAASALFETAWEWSAARGAREAVGPGSFTTNDEVGLLLDGYDVPPTILTTWNPRYYVDLWTAGGWEQVRDLYGWRLDRATDLSERQKKVLERIRQRSGLRVREGNIKDFDNEVSRFFEVYRSGWARNWGFAPMTEAEVKHLAKDLRRIIDTRLVIFVEDEETGEVAGCGLVLPDANHAMTKVRSGRLLPTGWWHLLRGAKTGPGIRIIALGIREGFQARAVGPLIYNAIMERAMSMSHLEYCEASWVLDDNHSMNGAIEAMGARHYKTWRMYRRPL